LPGFSSDIVTRTFLAASTNGSKLEKSSSPFLEIASVLVRFNQVAFRIVNANHSIM
jgi:hypothetical protein